MGIARKLIGTVTTTVVLAAGVAAAPAAQAAMTCPTKDGIVYRTCITSVSLSRTSIAITGGATLPLTATIGIHSDDGVPTGRSPFTNGTGLVRDLVPTLEFAIRNTRAQTTSYDRVGLTLVSGDNHDGMWRGTLNVSGIDAGTMTTQQVGFDGLGQPPMSYQTIPAALRRSTVVTAAHIPVFGTPPAGSPRTVHYNDPFSISGRVTDKLTGAGMARITVHVESAIGVCDCLTSDEVVTTDPSGFWTLRGPHARISYHFVVVAGPVNSDGTTPKIASSGVDGPFIIGALSAALSTTTGHPGVPVTVTGSAGPAEGQSILLEKWISHSWQVVSSEPVRGSGRFTLPTRAAPGHWEFRVADPAHHAVSAPMFLTMM